MASEKLLFIAGAVGGFVEAGVVHPFDSVKTRHQINQGVNENILQTLRSMYKEGGIQRWYRGLVPEAAGMIPKSSAMYASYEIVRRKLEIEYEYGDTAAVACAAGIASGVSEAVTVTPFQVVKVRLQAIEHVGRYQGPVDCLKQTVTEEGMFQGLSRGLGPTLWRNCVWNGVYFGTMHFVKANFLRTPESKVEDLAYTLFGGFFGGLWATCFNAPFDMVKSRVQSQLYGPSAKGIPPKYSGPTLKILYQVMKEEGLGNVYKGFAPKAIRMGLGGAVCMTTFETVIYLFK